MKAVILAGGSQSTIHPEREGIPKPMIEIGERPLLWHIMKSFSRYGINEFIVCGGYRVEMIKEYFLDYYIYASDITVDLSSNTVEIHKKRTDNWKVTVVNTGVHTAPLRRVEMVKQFLTDDFLVTYGDCLSDIRFDDLIKTHRDGGTPASIAMVRPTGRKQFLSFDENGEISLARLGNDAGKYAWINGNIYAFKPDIFPMLEQCGYTELNLLKTLSAEKRLIPFYHNGFWSSIETLHDLANAERMWRAKEAPWYGGEDD